nr:unnamed protein product [Digitaria exilis]
MRRPADARHASGHRVGWPGHDRPWRGRLPAVRARGTNRNRTPTRLDRVWLEPDDGRTAPATGRFRWWVATECDGVGGWGGEPVCGRDASSARAPSPCGLGQLVPSVARPDVTHGNHFRDWRRCTRAKRLKGNMARNDESASLH